MGAIVFKLLTTARLSNKSQLTLWDSRKPTGGPGQGTAAPRASRYAALTHVTLQYPIVKNTFAHRHHTHISHLTYMISAKLQFHTTLRDSQHPVN